MTLGQPDTEELVQRASMGDAAAAEKLLERHRARLRTMLAARMDSRLMQRIDPSDVIQETLMEAVRRLPDYLRDRPVPFYPWLRSIAWNRLIDLHRKHVLAKNRAVDREISLDLLNDKSAVHLAELLVVSASGPADQMLRQELHLRIRSGLSRLSANFQEILVLRHLENMSIAEIAAVLGISEGTVKSRHFRALAHIRKLLNEG